MEPLSLIQGEIYPYTMGELQTEVWQNQLTPEEILDKYKKKDSSLSIEKIKKDIKRWNIKPTFIDGYDLVDRIRKSIADYDATIATYTTNNRAGYRRLNLLIAEVKKIKDIIKKKDKDDIKKELEGMIELEFSIKDLVNIQQKDEQLRIEYFKLRQEDLKTFMKVVEIQNKALQTEAMLVGAFEELAMIDRREGTNYSYNFVSNVKNRVIKQLEHEKFLEVPKDGDREVIIHDISLIKNITKKKNKHPNNFIIACANIKKKYKVSHFVAQKLYSVWRKNNFSETIIQRTIEEWKADPLKLKNLFTEHQKKHYAKNPKIFEL